MLISIIKKAVREAYESSAENNFKGGGQKGNFKHMHIADSRHKGRRVAIMSSNGLKERVNLKNCEFQKGQ